ncbi:3-hydroxyacyl-CoA dehydrogenase NAD-binding domain-containing protein [Phenylobacterium immobile]|uniref:3-hydroxyacyl-CoA dehydrogenase NAD-binding domain-containing protein n=1 Tax=Phenylobacterium immobile TaxID=21 RepID=UPI000A841AFB|nr:3-hydroxyacyl-CoA dehydrogenase NAD-binding domain-containing protein [Phenylobacterium immobile]
MAKINAVTDLSYDGDIAVITLDSPPVNALSPDVQDGLYEGFAAAAASEARAIVLTCAGRTFIAGADIASIGRSGDHTLADVLALLDTLEKPTVAALFGTTLGGGLEVALACHYRVAVPSAQLGLPEVKLGLLPGGGGTQRLPRLIGVEAALDIAVSGRNVRGPEALKVGLIDALTTEGALVSEAIAFARKLVADAAPIRRVSAMTDKIEAARGKPELFEAFRKANARRMRGMEAPEAVISAIQAAVDLPFEEGLAAERKLFIERMMSPQSAALRYVFFAERAISKIPDIPADTPTVDIKTVGVLGAGTMGGGIAMTLLNAGLPVTIVEARQENLDRGLATIRKNYESTVKRGSLTEAEMESRLARLTPSLDMASAFAQVDLVIEAVFERLDVKQAVFKDLDRVCRPDAILASNTSFLDIDQIASVVSRPEQVIGLHFFAPANIMKLLEIVRGTKTAKSVVATAIKLSRALGKSGVVVRTCPGFIANRIMRRRAEQAQALLLEGADPAVMDKVIFDYGFPMGSLATMDLSGLDIIPDEPGKPTVRIALAEAGRLGQKNGKGFFDYDEARNPSPSPEAAQVVAAFAEKMGIARREISEQEILERNLYVVVNEAAHALEEGVVVRASDVDIAAIYGYGWPPYRGGPMFWADSVGLAKVVEALERYHAQTGDPMFAPAPLLKRLAAEGKTFQSYQPA